MFFWLIMLIFSTEASFIINSDNLIFKNLEKIAYFSGNVSIKHNDSILYSDNANVFIDKEYRFKSVLLLDNVRFTDKGYTVKCDKAKYSNKLIKLFGENIIIFAKNFKCRINDGNITSKKNGTVISGKIFLVGDDLKLKTNDALISHGNNIFTKIIFTHKITLLYRDMLVVSDSGYYDVQNEKIYLNGHITILKNNDFLLGEKLELDLKTKKYKLLSQVSGVLHAR